MKTVKANMKNEEVKNFLHTFKVGLEKESQRAFLDGSLSTLDHPSVLGNRSHHPYIQTDFSETQTELITDPFDSNQEALRQLNALHDVLIRSLEKSEILWPLSMPPILPEKDKDILIAKLEMQGDVNYRRYLAKVYGKRKQMVSGIHYNFEFSSDMLNALFANQNEYTSFTDFRTEVYLKVSRQYLRYRWLFTYLFGASPYADEGYFKEESLKTPVRSIRNSTYGYTNRPEVQVSYESLDQYIADLTRLVDNGDLIEMKEFYSPVRLRGHASPEQLLEVGVSYIEIRNIDINPFEKTGVSEEMMQFLHLFLVSLLWIDESDSDFDTSKSMGDQYNQQVSLENPLNKTDLIQEGFWLIQQMKDVLALMNACEGYQKVCEWAIDALNNPKETISAQMIKAMDQQSISNNDYAKMLGKQYSDESWEKPYQLAGYRELELSTQNLMFDAMQRGIKVEILDEYDQFLKLKFGNQIEYVKNGNMTSRDTYVVPLMMENKTVTKKVLEKAGFRVPLGKEYASLEDALSDYYVYQNKSIVVKPKSTNYGLGISIFKDEVTEADFKKALEIAFSEDTNVLVEEFLPGTEYRFFVIENEVKAIMLRVPANIVGDGVHTVKELVDIKNDDILRGSHHRAPLEKIKIGPIETLMLKEQNMDADKVPSKNQVIYLRENSNVSTGGDSIDFTDQIHSSYKDIAASAVRELGAVVCGIDLIIPDAFTENIPGKECYGIIEANFNPAMHMHMYPYQGIGRRLTQDILDLLFPESKK